MQKFLRDKKEIRESVISDLRESEKAQLEPKKFLKIGAFPREMMVVSVRTEVGKKRRAKNGSRKKE